MLKSPIARLRLIGLIESISWFVLLFVAVPVKRFPWVYGLETGDETLVKVLGPIHGALWVLYLLAIADARWRAGLANKLAWFTVGCTFLPFPLPLLVLDPKLKKLEAGAEEA